MGFLGEPTNELPARWPYLGTIDALPDFIHGHVVDEVAVCLVTEDWALIEWVTSLCESEGKIVRMPVPDATPVHRHGSHVEDLDGTPVLTLLTGPRSSLAFGGKRGTRPRRGRGSASRSCRPLLLGIALGVWSSRTGATGALSARSAWGCTAGRFSLFKFRSMVQGR